MGTDVDIAHLRRRVDALEERVDLEAELRASVDADLADAKTFQRVVLRQLNSVGQTLSEHGRLLHGMSQVLVRIEGRLDGHDEALARHDEAFTRNDAAIARHDEALSRHDGMLADILAAVRPGDSPAPGAQPG
jgi:uncharacterized protein (DUF3084 family)